MGGSSGNIIDSIALERLRMRQRSQEETAIAAFSSELSAFLSDLLSNFNRRDVALVEQRLQQAKTALKVELSGSFDTLFGGSVAKHTYVDGLSDIDCLAVISDSELADRPPREVLARMRDVLQAKLSGVAVSVGAIALTLGYNDGMSVQMLPAERDGHGRLRVPSWSDGDAWSRIEPRSFLDALTRRNGECGGKLVPTIKLAKAVIAGLPAAHRIGGYHVESLAIDAFQGYAEEKTPSAMLPRFFERARTLVLEPIRDSTGQSVHVDYELGERNSQKRQAVSLQLGRIAKRMAIASAAASLEQWSNLFGLDD